MSVSIPQQTLYPPQSIFSEVQAIHDTGVFYSRESDTATTSHTTMTDTGGCGPEFYVSILFYTCICGLHAAGLGGAGCPPYC